MDGWISIGTASASVLAEVRARMERKGDGEHRAQAVAVTREAPGGSGAADGGNRGISLVAGESDHAAASKTEPHCEAIASAIPGNVRLRSFQRSGPGGMR